MLKNITHLIFLLCCILCNKSEAQYCASNATSTADSKLDNIRLVGQSVTINQNSAGPCQTYTDYTALPAADLRVGNTYTVNVTLGTCGGNYSKSASVFIDWNLDNDFTDAGENVGNTGFTTPTATLNVVFTVGACGTPTLGTTRMRIVCQEGGSPAPCGTYTYGETEDYRVTIVTNPSPPPIPQFRLVGSSIQTSPQCIQLTAAANGQLGLAWDVRNRLNFLAPFSYDFIVNLGSSDGGADGIMFIIQNDPEGPCVAAAGGWGAGNIAPSLCVEIDTYLNSEDRDDGLPSVICAAGPEPDHLDIWLNGNVNPAGTCGVSPGARIIPAAIPLLNGGVNYNVENGLNHVFRVSWAPGAPGTFTARLMNAAATVTYGVVTYSFTALTLFGTNTPMYGLSGSTGGLNNQQSFCIPSTLLLDNKIINFDATLNIENEVDLDWEAVNDNAGDYFVIEKSKNAVDFHEFITIPTEGAINQTNSYKTVDPNPYIGNTYYRLKMVAVDGSFVYSDIRAVNRKAIDAGNIHIYPNPVQNSVTVELTEGAVVSIELHNSLGQQIAAPVLQNGSKSVLNLSNLASGVYLLQVETDNSSKRVFKIVKE